MYFDKYCYVRIEVHSHSWLLFCFLWTVYKARYLALIAIFDRVLAVAFACLAYRCLAQCPASVIISLRDNFIRSFRRHWPRPLTSLAL